VEEIMKDVALGFRAHSGWTAMVGLCLEKDQPQVLLRQRPKLVQQFTYEFRQPYHTAEKMPMDTAREFVSQIESAATWLAASAIRTVQLDLRKQGYEITCFGLPVGSARPLPSFEKILLSHALVHTADGELFRRALIRACEQCHISGLTLRERELVAIACKAWKVDKNDLLVRLAKLGKPMGPPWSQDEKFAAMAAWLALLGGEKSRSAGPANEGPDSAGRNPRSSH
jgi:hypothetical protein